MQSLRVFLNQRLSAVAEEIFDAVEKTIVEYRQEIFRSKDLEISRLRMRLKLLRSESDRCFEAKEELHHSGHRSPPPPAQQQLHSVAPEPELHEEEEEEDGEDTNLDQEHPETSRVKQEEKPEAPNHFWVDHDDSEHLDDLESDIKDFISPPNYMKTNLHEHNPHFQLFINSSSCEESRGDRSYSCSICEKRFSNCSHLAAHIRTHTGERPYMCEICKKTFITTSALNRHQTIHTEGKHFVCNCCGKSFKWMESLGRHMRSVHKKESVPEGVPAGRS
ncbi:zinc finger and SCAN domain-containing protein 5B [Nothobranchius furzeri]|uniref:Zinc finger protein 701-like n=5 Tax=Nothobranchius TaxID=28779 RepID=A0A8C6KA54_NOTFU|nr:zinc finger protein 701-like [Nothobranchius furzeri]